MIIAIVLFLIVVLICILFTTFDEEDTKNNDDNYEENDHQGWIYLECEKDKYFFSEKLLSWKEAFEECKLFGGWLVNVGTQSEQNCLVDYGRAQNYNEWFWTDGRHTTK